MTTTALAYPHVSGKRADGQVVVGLVPQFDGSAFGASNCGAAAEAARDIAERLGQRPPQGSPWYPTGQAIRAATGDRSGGLMPSQTQAATRRIYNIVTPAVRIEPWTHVLELLWAHRTVDILIRYAPIDDVLSGSPGFRGNHRGTLSGIRRLDNGRIQVRWADPLYDGRRLGIPRGPQWIDADIMRRAAGGLELQVGETVTDRYGSGHAYCIPTNASYTTTTPAPTTPVIVTSAPTPKEVNAMIASAHGIQTDRVQRLAKGQPLFKHPGGPLVTRMSRAGDVGYIGSAGGDWGAVLVFTGAPYRDGQTRPTGLYVPLAAGPIRAR